MALTLRGTTSSAMFTAQFQNLIISSDDEYIDLKLSVDSTHIFTQRYYTFNGTIALHALNTLIESHMRSQNLRIATATITLIADSDDTQIHTQTLIFCETIRDTISADTFITSRFLTDRQSARIPATATIYLAAILIPGETNSLRITTIYREDSTIKTAESNIQFPPNGNQYTHYTFNRYLPQLFPTDTTPLSVTLWLGSRSFTYFIDPTPTTLSLAYTNRFNTFETTSLPAVTTDKIEVDRTLAQLSETAQFYDRKITKTFETEVDSLTYLEALHLEQLLASPFVALITDPDEIEDGNFDDLPEILITDFTSEPSNSDETLNKIKFTWRFADNRRHAKLPIPADRTYTTDFTETFS